MPTVVNDYRFASKKEARRYQELLLLGHAGLVRNLELQPTFPLRVRADEAPVTWIVGHYRADFRYEELQTPPDQAVHWLDVTEDCKGMKTAVYRLKKRMVEAQYGISVRET